MSKLLRTIIAIALAAGVLILVPFLWAGVEYVRFREVASFNVDLGTVLAYSEKYSYSKGEAVDLYVHGTGRITADLYRLGASRELVRGQLEIDAVEQSSNYDLFEGVDWELTETITTDDLRPGLYVLQLENNEAGDRFIVPFVIKNPSVDIAVIVSTNTWDAYNAFGGVSNYENAYLGLINRRLIAEVEWWGGRFQDTRLPYARPNIAISDDLLDQADPDSNYFSRLARHEWTFIAFLESQGYDYGIFTDRDFSFTDDWMDAKAVVFPGHAEYWTSEMYFPFERYLDTGGRVLMTAGNPMLRPVEYGDLALVFPQLENRPKDINELVGASFTSAGRSTAAGFRLLAPKHWVFENTGLDRGDIFGKTSFARPVSDYASNPAGDSDGASGLFTMEPGMGSGGFETLAIGMNPEGPAHMMYRDTGFGGWVFNSSSATFTGAVAKDEIVGQLVRNLLDEALSSERPG